MNDDARQTLTKLVSKYGPGLADDRAKLRGLLRDLCHGPDAGVQIRWIATAAEEGVPRALQAGTSPMSAETRLAQAVQRFEHTVGVQGGLARWGVESWAIALGLVAPASPAVPAAGAPPQAAAPDDPFAAPARLEPEQELRTAICQALADGVVTEQERTWLQSERERLGLSSTVASRLFAEEKARATEAAAQPQIGDDGLDDDTAWQATVSSVLGKPEALQSEAYGEYLSRFPEGRHRGGIPAGSLRQLLLKDLLNQRLRRDYLAARTPALLSADLQLASGVPYRVWAVMANLLIIPLWLAYGASWSAADIDFLGWTLGGAGVCTPVWVILAGLRDVRKRSYARFGPLPREAYAKSLVEVRQGFGLGVSHDGGIEVPNDGKEGPR